MCAQFYADEAHSINYGPNSPAHIYKLLTKKTRHCFNLEAPPSTRLYKRLRKGKKVNEMQTYRKKSDQEDFEMMIEKPRALMER